MNVSGFRRVECQYRREIVLVTDLHRLVLDPYWRGGFSTPVLTVELATKWRCLHLLRTSASALPPEAFEVPYDVLPVVGGYQFVDHVPHPDSVRALAEAEGWHLDEFAEGLVEGRWKLERAP